MTITQINYLESKIAECDKIINWCKRELADTHSTYKPSIMRADLKKQSQRKESLIAEIEAIKNSESHKHLVESFKVFESFIEELIQEWMIWAIHKQETINATEEKIENEYIESGLPKWQASSKAYDETRSMFGAKDYDLYARISKEALEKMFRADAISLVENLIARVESKVGIVKDYSNLSVSVKDGILNGVVSGEKGTVKVTSIWAGGYNIQRLHIRVLVK